jgi:hypothetical protein
LYLDIFLGSTFIADNFSSFWTEILTVGREICKRFDISTIEYSNTRAAQWQSINHPFTSWRTFDGPTRFSGRFCFKSDTPGVSGSNPVLGVLKEVGDQGPEKALGLSLLLYQI